MWYLFAAVSILGHFAVSIWIINRIHATALPHWFVKCLDKIWYAFLFGLPLAIVLWLAMRPSSEYLTWERIGDYCIIYGLVCTVAVGFTLVVSYFDLAQLAITKRLAENHTHVVNIQEQLGHRPVSTISTRVISSLPRNQVFQLSVHKKFLRLPELPPELDGLTITHLSDLHFTGRITKPFFDEVVEQANLLQSDLVAITGDIIDKPKCMPWLRDVLGKLNSKHGTFFILGNHDLRVKDETGVRQALIDNGHIDLGGRWKVVRVNNHPILLGGNERPWFVRATDMSECPTQVDGKKPYRILLSHSPDQIKWANQNKFDLMLAGHTHGGQIRFPWIGPVFAPSWYGVKFAAGTFYEEPTLLHVSRGISGTPPIRFNCPPELTQLILSSS